MFAFVYLETVSNVSTLAFKQEKHEVICSSKRGYMYFVADNDPKN